MKWIIYIMYKITVMDNTIQEYVHNSVKKHTR